MGKFTFTQTEIPGVVVIEPQVFGDDRGYFMETYQKDQFAEAGIDKEFVQDNQSRSTRGVLRGLHFHWADDLSSYDSVLSLPFNIPFYGDHVSLFALLMTVALFAFSYINYQQTASSQPQMAGMKFMMVYLMPVMMLLWFNSYSSGLTYYYFLANILTIGQTLVIRRMIDDEKIHAVMQANAAKNKNRKKSKFQLRYEELLRQQEEAQRNASRRK